MLDLCIINPNQSILEESFISQLSASVTSRESAFHHVIS